MKGLIASKTIHHPPENLVEHNYYQHGSLFSCWEIGFGWWKLIQLLGKCDSASPRMTGLWKSGKAS